MYLSYHIFQYVADFIHVLAIIILFIKLFKTKACADISGKTQILLATVCITRYLDLFTNYQSGYLKIGKITLLVASVSFLFLIFVEYRETYDRSNDSFPIVCLLVPAYVLASFVNHDHNIFEVLWTFSIYLEAVAILPQLILLKNTGKIYHLTRYYLLALGLYRGIYLINWVWRYAFEGHYDLIATFAGIVQTNLMIVTVIVAFKAKSTEDTLNGNNVEETINKRQSTNYENNLTRNNSPLTIIVYPELQDIQKPSHIVHI